MANQLSLPSPAKINLGLWVGRKRPDGFHDIITVIVPLEFGDTVRIAPAKHGIQLRTTDPALPDDDTNLAWRAADRFFGATGRSPGCRIDIEKRIPVGAGLGGGSSNAATVLLGLNRLHRRPLSDRQLLRMAAELGSDVPALLRRAPVVARGRGERLRPIRIPKLRVLLHLPGFAVSTGLAYGGLDRSRQRLTSPPLLPKILGLKLRQGGLEGLARHVFNDFERVVFTRHRRLAAARDRLLAEGVLVAGLSGSGSTVYGLADAKGWQNPMAAMNRHGFHCISTSSLPARP